MISSVLIIQFPTPCTTPGQAANAVSTEALSDQEIGLGTVLLFGNNSIWGGWGSKIGAFKASTGCVRPCLNQWHALKKN